MVTEKEENSEGTIVNHLNLGEAGRIFNLSYQGLVETEKVNWRRWFEGDVGGSNHPSNTTHEPNVGTVGCCTGKQEASFFVDSNIYN